MPDQSLPNEEFLRKEFIEQKILEITNPQLDYVGVLPAVKADALSVKFKKDTTSAYTDTRKKTPRRLSEFSRFTFVDISELTVDAAILSASGFAMKVSRDAIRFAEGIDEIQRGLNRIGFWLAEDINTKIASKIQAEATGPTTALGTPTVWSDAGTKPVVDLLNMEDDMVQIGYPYKLTESYLHKTNYRELMTYLLTIDAKFGTGDKANNIAADSLTIPVLNGLTVHRVQSGIAEGSIMGLDKNNPCGTFYYNLDPKFSTNNIDGMYFNVNVEEKAHETIVEVWADWDVAIKEPKAAIWGASRI